MGWQLRGEVEGRNPEPESVNSDRPEESVLVVAEEFATRQNLIAVLASAEIRALGADVAEAMDLQQRHHSSVALVEHAAAGPDGFALAARIKEHDAETPVLLLTDPDSLGLAQPSANVDGYLVKPLVSTAFVQTVREALSQRAMAEQNKRLARLLEAMESNEEVPEVVGAAVAGVATELPGASATTPAVATWLNEPVLEAPSSVPPSFSLADETWSQPTTEPAIPVDMFVETLVEGSEVAPHPDADFVVPQIEAALVAEPEVDAASMGEIVLGEPEIGEFQFGVPELGELGEVVVTPSGEVVPAEVALSEVAPYELAQVEEAEMEEPGMDGPSWEETWTDLVRPATPVMFGHPAGTARDNSEEPWGGDPWADDTSSTPQAPFGLAPVAPVELDPVVAQVAEQPVDSVEEQAPDLSALPSIAALVDQPTEVPQEMPVQPVTSVEPVFVEPVQMQDVPAQRAIVEPVQVQDVPAQRAIVEPVQVQDVPAQPAIVEPEPVQVQDVPVQPAIVEPEPVHALSIDVVRTDDLAPASDAVRQVLTDVLEQGAAAVCLVKPHLPVRNDIDWSSHRDEVFEMVESHLSSALRRSDAVVAMGDGQFLVVCSEVESAVAAELIASGIVRGLSAPMAIPGSELCLEVSIGIVLAGNASNEGPRSAEELLDDASLALRQAMEEGKPWMLLDEGAGDKIRLREKLIRAMDNGELHLDFQKVVSLETHEVVGAEAFLRWSRPGREVLPAADFLDEACGLGLAVKLGRWVVDKALSELSSWRARGPLADHFTLFVNVSSEEVVDLAFAEVVEKLLSEHGVPAEMLSLEIPESTLGEAAVDSHAVAGLHYLAGLGVKCVVDDFGTGRSNLDWLQALPITGLKINPELVHALDRSGDRRGLALVRGVIALAHELQMHVVGEGVESLSQEVALRAMGCDLAQGYYVGRPVGADQLAAEIGL